MIGTSIYDRKVSDTKTNGIITALDKIIYLLSHLGEVNTSQGLRYADHMTAFSE
jgi:hypothetical protein